MRFVTWNCRRATSDSSVWPYFLKLDPDVAVLQDVCEMAESVGDRYEIRSSIPVKKSGKPQSFQNLILVKGTIVEPIVLSSEQDWVNKELAHFSGNLSAWRVQTQGGPTISVVNTYSPAWPVDRTRLTDIDTTGVKLTQSPDVWVADLMLPALRSHGSTNEEQWIIAGDFNLSETFDSWSGGPHGNREYLDRMTDLGFTECLRSFAGELTPTFKNTSNAKILHQMDHVFVSAGLASALSSCATGSHEEVFDAGLSDHLPVIADFGSEKSAVQT